MVNLFGHLGTESRSAMNPHDSAATTSTVRYVNTATNMLSLGVVVVK